MALVSSSGVALTPTRRTHRRTIVASGAAIKLDDQTEIARYRRRAGLDFWHERAWIYNDEIPELSFAHNFVRNAMSRVRLVPAIESDDPEAPPVPLDDDTTPDGLDPDLCTQVLDRLRPWPNLMGSIAFALDIPGETFVALIPDDDEITGERCRVLSKDELLVRGESWYLKDDPSDPTGRELPANTELFRLWNPDGRWSSMPTSPMRALIEIADTLMLSTQMLRGIMRSRVALNAGFLWVSNDVSLESAATDDGVGNEDAGDGEGREDTFIEDFFEAATAAMMDHTSAAAALPIILRGDGKPADNVAHIPVARPLEDTFIKIRTELIDRIANGLDLPREIVLGIGQNSNHWTAEQIKENNWHDHLETRALSIVSGITQAFYRPQLRALGVDPKLVPRCTVWYDPSWFLGSPDLADSADQALQDYAISLETWRRVKGYSEDDAPSQDEIDYRIGIKQRENIRIREQGVAPGGLVESDTEGLAPTPTPQVAPPGGAPAPPQADPQVKVPGTPAPTPNGKKAQVASGGPPALDRLGGRIVNIERDLRTRLLQLADATMTRALERAGGKVRGKVQSRATLSAELRDVPSTELTATVGKATVHSFGLTEEALLAGALGDLEHRYHALVLRAQHAAAQAAAAATGDSVDLEAVDAQTEDARNAGWLLLSGGLTALAYKLLYDPHPEAPAVGEFDSTTLVSPGLVRAALDVAGGGSPPDAPPSPDARPAGGGATGGPSMLDEFKAQLGIVDDTYTWVYGDAPRKTFEPHLALDGVTFTSWDDDVLAATDDWPPVDFYRPSDHDGCQCDFETSFSQVPTDDGTTEEAA